MKRLPLATALAVAFAFPAFAGKINVNTTVQNAINNDAAARNAVLSAMGVSDKSWKITSVKISKLNPGALTINMPPYKFEYVTGTEIVNCAPTATSRTVSLGKEVTNSVTITKSDTLDVGAEVSVSGSYMGVSASATASTNYSVTNEKSESSSKTERVEDSTTVGFDDTGGRISVLQAKKMQGNKIPWSATFTPGDSDPIEFTAGSSVAGNMCLHEHTSYGGKKKCFGAGDVANVGKEWNDEVTAISLTGGYSVTIYEHKDYGGKSKTYTSSVANVGKDWNDKLTSFKVHAPVKTATVAYSAIKNSIPVAARTFTVRGDMDVSQTSFQDKRIVNYVMPEKDVQETCGNIPTGGNVMASRASAPSPAKPTVAGAKAPAPAAATAPSTAKPTREQAAAALKIRPLTDAELQKKLASAKEIK